MKTATLKTQSLLGAGTLAFMVFATAPLVQAALSDATFQLSTGTGTYDQTLYDESRGMFPWRYNSSTISYQAGSISTPSDVLPESAAAAIIQGSDPHLTVSAFSSSLSTYSEATATYTYSFEVNSPVGGSVGALVSANGGATMNRSALWTDGFARITIGIGPPGPNDTAGPIVLMGILGADHYSQNFPLNAYPLTLAANTEYSVQLWLYADANDATASAWIDPQISIDPAYLSANNLNPADYTLNFSPNFAPVPEPSTVIAGALSLLPFVAGALRILRKRQLA